MHVCVYAATTNMQTGTGCKQYCKVRAILFDITHSLWQVERWACGCHDLVVTNEKLSLILFTGGFYL